MTDDSEEWGPWIEHDGKGCPCVGFVVLTKDRSGRLVGPLVAWSGNAAGHDDPDQSNWAWRGDRSEVIRYRIRKPRALRQLIEMVENLPAPSKQRDRVK